MATTCSVCGADDATFGDGHKCATKRHEYVGILSTLDGTFNPVEIEYYTGRPPLPEPPRLAEEEKGAMAEAANTMIDYWNQQRTVSIGSDGYVPPPFVPFSTETVEAARQNALDAINAHLGARYGLRFGYEPAQPTAPPLAPPVDRAFKHAMAVHVMKAFRTRKPYLLGVDLGCACHPWPNHAGRDYRRRTKHRNRRRKS